MANFMYPVLEMVPLNSGTEFLTSVSVPLAKPTMVRKLDLLHFLAVAKYLHCRFLPIFITGFNCM
jgi:hypothetical protein